MSLKTFNLTPVITSSDLGGEKFQGCIQCMELSQENLYLGTTDRFIFHFSLDKTVLPTGEHIYANKLQRKKHFGLVKPIKQLLACSVIGQLLILSDSIVYIVSMIGLESRGGGGTNKELFKGVTVMARNDKPPVFKDDEVQLCIGTHRKTVQVIDLANNRFTLVREIGLRSSPSLLSFDSETICAVIGRQYYLINWPASSTQDLFACEENVIPAIKRTGHEEFLLNGPTNEMGMIVTSGGVSQHQPLWWADGFRSAAYCYPYILVLGRISVTVHSMLDQKQKEIINLNGGMFIDNLGDSVLIVFEQSIKAFTPIALDEQIQVLLLEKNVEEAFDLLLVATKTKPREYNEAYKKQIQAQAGFIYFADANFKRAMNLFLECSLDPREVIVLYPLMLSKDCNFTPSRPLLHTIDNLSSLIKGSRPMFASYKKFLLEFMEISQYRFPEANIEVDTTLMKLYAEANNPKLAELVSSKNNIVVDEAISWLSQSKRYHSLALFYNYIEQRHQAMDIWHQLVHNEIEDTNFPGISFLVNYLTNCSDASLIFSSTKWLLDLDQSICVKIFTERKNENMLDFGKVYDFIQDYPTALSFYLEYLVFNQQNEEERFQTHLACIYTDELLKLLQDNIALDEDRVLAKSKLHNMLEQSSSYDASVIFNKIINYPLHEEIAILYGKMDQHDKALEVLVYQLKDYNVAERYCNTVCIGRDLIFRKNVFHILLGLYLKPKDDNARPEHFVMPAIRLLNSHQKDFNFLQVLETLPEDWPIEMISPFLVGSMRTNLTNTYQTSLERNIMRLPYEDTKFELVNLHLGRIKVCSELQCNVCNQPFTNSTCVRYPNEIVAHPKCCKDKSICPVTGTNFLRGIPGTVSES